ncbi:MAG: hypothetical protein QOJ16_1451 [Acidobacteriota bacterium]|nr:hypothetical protein [Acidobacteriota bacterium]
MNSVDSLPAALFRHAASRPEEPWLFHRRGWDWPWLPWRAVAARVASWSEALAGVPLGTRAAFADWPGPLSIALDLALQAAGLISTPIPEELPDPELAAALAARQAEVWIEPAGSRRREGAAALTRWELPAWNEEGPSGLDPSGPPPSLTLLRPAGGVVLEDGRELAAADLVAAAATIEVSLPADRRGREILVAFRSLSDPATRRLLAWATWTGAALLLESDRAAGGASAVWARPTVFHGDASDLAVLRRALAGRRLLRPIRPRLPFGRLHTIFVEGVLPDDERAFWEGRGVRLV